MDGSVAAAISVLSLTQGLAFTHAVEQFGKKATTVGSEKLMWRSPVLNGWLATPAVASVALIFAGVPGFVSIFALTTLSHIPSAGLVVAIVALGMFELQSNNCFLQVIVKH